MTTATATIDATPAAAMTTAGVASAAATLLLEDDCTTAEDATSPGGALSASPVVESAAEPASDDVIALLSCTFAVASVPDGDLDSPPEATAVDWNSVELRELESAPPLPPENSASEKIQTYFQTSCTPHYRYGEARETQMHGSSQSYNVGLYNARLRPPTHLPVHKNR